RRARRSKKWHWPWRGNGVRLCPAAHCSTKSEAQAWPAWDSALVWLSSRCWVRPSSALHGAWHFAWLEALQEAWRQEPARGLLRSRFFDADGWRHAWPAVRLHGLLVSWRRRRFTCSWRAWCCETGASATGLGWPSLTLRALTGSWLRRRGVCIFYQAP